MTGMTDREQIFALFDRYADALDHREWALLERLFTEDVTTDWFGAYQVSGRAEVIAYISDLVGRTLRTHHMLGNYTADVQGDTAEASARVRAYHVGEGDLFEESLAGFEATAVRTPDGWRFSRFDERLYVMLGTQEVFGLTDEAVS
ncbi:nuclear transport factor 2 family protein [Streptosporangium sp. NPDC000239]|uniref:nuclear transport factor 2 family protein n=1 Tax=unclassified Streptosporangium TaxID=2632669 RepID=UPI003323D539